MAGNTPAYRVLLYYLFRDLSGQDLEALRLEHEQFCQQHNLLGRIILAEEGLNGTVSGLVPDTETYKAWLQQHACFSGIEFKEEAHEGHTFHKLHVRVKPEIVHFGVEQASKPWQQTGKYIEPAEMRALLERRDKGELDEEFIIFDARSAYETAVGRFRGAQALPIENFRDLPEHVEALQQIKDKKVITYCTGGIKCEKLTAWLIDQGFSDVHQLHGGIVRYAQEAEGYGFEGECYVFDERVVVPVNQADPSTIGECYSCGAATSQMVNCANATCNIHILLCPDCAEAYQGCCGPQCMESPRRRAWDGTGQYLRGINSKNYVENPCS